MGLQSMKLDRHQWRSLYSSTSSWTLEAWGARWVLGSWSRWWVLGFSVGLDFTWTCCLSGAHFASPTAHAPHCTASARSSSFCVNLSAFLERCCSLVSTLVWLPQRPSTHSDLFQRASLAICRFDVRFPPCPTLFAPGREHFRKVSRLSQGIDHLRTLRLLSHFDFFHC